MDLVTTEADSCFFNPLARSFRLLLGKILLYLCLNHAGSRLPLYVHTSLTISRGLLRRGSVVGQSGTPVHGPGAHGESILGALCWN